MTAKELIDRIKGINISSHDIPIYIDDMKEIKGVDLISSNEQYGKAILISTETPKKVHLLIVGDFNDADYGKNIISIDQETFDKFKPFIDAINNFTPYVQRHQIGGIDYDNWESYRPDLGELEIEEKYPQFSKEYIEEFKRIFIDGISIPEEACDPFDGPKSIESLENILTGEKYIDGSYETLKERHSEKVKEYLKERSKILSYKREDGKDIRSIPYNKMNDKESDLLNELNNLWRKYV